MTEKINIDGKEFFLPMNIRIGRNDATEKLYTLEENSFELRRKIVRELGKILGHEIEELWSKSYPQHLFDTLVNMEKGSAVAAAMGFLKKEGYEIIKVKHAKQKI